MARPLAALTGATGFLGGWLAPALHAAGYDLRLLARRQPASTAWAGLDHQLVIGGLDQDDALGRLVQGASLVVHGAGLIKARNRRSFFEVNEDGARRMGEAQSRLAPQAHFIQISSIAAREPHLSDYAASKAAGEAAVRGLLPAERLTVVRPPAVYGPGDMETLALFRAASKLPVLPVPGSPAARVALIHVADAAAICAAIATRAPDGSTFTLSDASPAGYRWREIMQAACHAVGRSPLLIDVPGFITMGLGLLGAAAGRFGGPIPILTPGKARELLHPDWAVMPQDLAPGLPPSRFDIVEGFADTVAWARSEGWL